MHSLDLSSFSSPIAPDFFERTRSRQQDQVVFPLREAHATEVEHDPYAIRVLQGAYRLALRFIMSDKSRRIINSMMQERDSGASASHSASFDPMDISEHSFLPRLDAALRDWYEHHRFTIVLRPSLRYWAFIDRRAPFIINLQQCVSRHSASILWKRFACAADTSR